MKIKKFDEGVNKKLNRDKELSEKLNKEETVYEVWGEQIYDKDGKMYPHIKPEVIVGPTTLDSALHFYQMYQRTDKYDSVVMTKNYYKKEVISEEDIKVLMSTNKYNL